MQFWQNKLKFNFKYNQMKQFSNMSISSQKPERNTEKLRAIVGELEGQANRFINALPVIYDELDRIDQATCDPDPLDPDPVDPDPDPVDPDPVPVEPIGIEKYKTNTRHFPIQAGNDYYIDVPSRAKGQDRDERELFDIYIPHYTKKGLKPLAYFEHGGGMFSYSRKVTRSVRNGIDVPWDFPKDIARLQKEGIAFLSMGYAFLDIENPKKSRRSWELLDRMDYSLQYLKYHAPEFGVDPDRIILAGISAGSFWAHRAFFGPDKKLQKSADPVLLMSSKPYSVATRFTNTTEDVRIWENEIFKEWGFNMSQMYAKLTPAQKAQHLAKFQASFGIERIEDLYNPAIIDSVMEKVNAVRYINKDTPEFWIGNFWDQQPKNPNVLGHHGNHAKWLSEYARAKGQTNHTAYWGPVESGKAYSSRPNPESWLEYVIRKSFE